MKIISGLFVFIIILVIIGGLGYIGYSYYTQNMVNMNMEESPNNGNGNNAISGMDGSSMNQNNMVPNPQITKDIDKLTEAINLINQALGSITIDPYSSATIPSDTMDMSNMKDQTSQGNSTFNIYSSDSSSIHINPFDSEVDTTDEMSPSQNMAGMDMTGSDMNEMNMKPNNYVYDQGKLEQLHNGIFTMSQGLYMINELNNDLTEQSLVLEYSPATYQTYVNRYNNSSDNRNKLEQAIQMLNQASVLVNVNPYAGSSGYAYDTDSMSRMHKGVFKLAEGMAMLATLKDDFTKEMASATYNVQLIVNGSSTTGMDMIDTSGMSILGYLDTEMILKILIVVLIIGLIVGVLGAINNLFRGDKRVKAIHRHDDHPPIEGDNQA